MGRIEGPSRIPYELNRILSVLPDAFGNGWPEPIIYRAYVRVPRGGFLWFRFIDPCKQSSTVGVQVLFTIYLMESQAHQTSNKVSQAPLLTRYI